MQGSVSEESGVMTDVDQSIEDTEEKYRKRREGTPSLLRDLWISAASLMKFKKKISHMIYSELFI